MSVLIKNSSSSQNNITSINLVEQTYAGGFYGVSCILSTENSTIISSFSYNNVITSRGNTSVISGGINYYL